MGFFVFDGDDCSLHEVAKMSYSTYFCFMDIICRCMYSVHFHELIGYQLINMFVMR